MRQLRTSDGPRLAIVHRPFGKLRGRIGYHPSTMVAVSKMLHSPDKRHARMSENQARSLVPFRFAKALS